MNRTHTLLRIVSGAALAALGLASCEPARDPDAAAAPSAAAGEVAEGETLAQILQDEDAYARVRRLAELLPGRGPESVPEVTAVLQRWNRRRGTAEFELLVRFWASHEPEAATNWCLLHSDPALRIVGTEVAMELWAREDPQAALQFVDEVAHGSDDTSRAAQRALVRGWYAAGHPGLEQYVHDLAGPKMRQPAIGNYAWALVENEGADALVRWAESVPDDDERFKTEVYRQVGHVLTQTDLEAGRRWCDAHCDGPYGKNLRWMVARSWVQAGRALEVFDWLSGLPPSLDRKIVLQQSLGFWSRLDREAALAWIEGKLEGEQEPWVRDLYGKYAALIVEDSPARAAEWGERVDPEEREPLLIYIGRVWREQDEAAMEAWLQGSSLSEEARQRVRTGRAIPRKIRFPEPAEPAAG